MTANSQPASFSDNRPSLPSNHIANSSTKINETTRSPSSISAIRPRSRSNSVAEFPLWRPVTDDSLQKSFYLPSTATLAAVQQTLRNTPLNSSNSKSKNSHGNNNGTGGIERSLSPMATLLIRIDY